MNGISDDATQPHQPALPRTGRLLGVDYGRVRVGLAISDDAQSIALPLDTLQRRTESLDAQYVRDLLDDYQPVGIVVGLPVHMSGEEGEQAAAARAFGSWLAGVSGLPVVYWDERFTSAAADVSLQALEFSKERRRQLRDRLAAQALLQGYLDAPDRMAPPRPYRD
jgi:putative Holliday junction resolvase